MIRTGFGLAFGAVLVKYVGNVVIFAVEDEAKYILKALAKSGNKTVRKVLDNHNIDYEKRTKAEMKMGFHLE